MTLVGDWGVDIAEVLSGLLTLEVHQVSTWRGLGFRVSLPQQVDQRESQLESSFSHAPTFWSLL